MPFLLPTDKKKALLARKEQLLNEIKYYEKRIHEVSQDTVTINFEDSSDSEDECPFTINNGLMIFNLKEQEKMLQTCLSATRELCSLYVLQSKVDIMVEDPVFEGEPLKTKSGLWKEVNADCQIDLVHFTTTFYVHQADGLFGVKSFRNLKVVPVKPSQEAELEKSVLKRVATPSDAVEVLRNYSTAYRSRRATLARLADKYQSSLHMEPLPKGGFLLKCADLLEISWVLENKWSCIMPFYHKMVFDLDVIDECYLKIIRHAHKQLNDPSTDTNERTLILTKIINTCLEARGTQLEESIESDTESVQKIEKRRLTLENEAPEHKRMKNDNKNNDNEHVDANENNKENINMDDQIMAPPKSLPKKVKPKGKENTDQNRKSAKRPAGEDEAGNAKKVKTNKIDPNNVNKNNKNKKVDDDVQTSNQDVNHTEDKNKNSVAKIQGSKLNKQKEKTQSKAIDAKYCDTEKKISTGNVKDIQKVTKSKNLEDKVAKKQNNDNESVKENVKAIKSQNQKVKEQSNAIGTKNNVKEKVGSTQNVIGNQNVIKNQILKNKAIKIQNNEKESVKESKKVKVTKPKNQLETAVAKENTDIQKEIVNKKQIQENANVQENLKKKVVKDTDCQNVINNDKIAENSSKNDQIAKKSESKKILDEVTSQPQNDQKIRNSEAQKVRNEKKVACSNNAKKSNPKELNHDQQGIISPKADLMPPKIISTNKAKLIEIDDIPIMSTYNVDIEKVSKKDHNNAKPVKLQKVAIKKFNVNEIALKNDKCKNNPKFDTNHSDNNKKSNQNVKKSAVNKETKPNNKIVSSDNAVSKNDQQLVKNNTNKPKSKNIQNNLKDVQKTNAQKLKPTPEDINKNTVNSNNRETVTKELNKQNQEKNINNKENAENNPKVTDSNVTTKKVTKIGNNKTKEHLVNLKKSNTKIDAKPKIVAKIFALSKKTSKKLNNSFEIKVNSGTKIDIENDSGSKISKIPMKLSVHNPLRVSPRRLPVTFKSASDSNVKQKNYFTNIPRLTKNTVFNKISK